jgi:hypothetical protein
MKCIKNKTTGEILKVSDDTADVKVKLFGWSFIPKSEWKTQVRDFNKTVNVEVKAEAVVDKKLNKRLKLKEKQGVWAK